MTENAPPIRRVMLCLSSNVERCSRGTSIVEGFWHLHRNGSRSSLLMAPFAVFHPLGTTFKQGASLQGASIQGASMASPEAEAPPSKRRSPRIDADKKCRTAAKQLASAVTERVWGLAVAPDGKEYYYHLNTNATAWSLPAGAILQADGDTYVSEEQHRLSPRISPKAKASPSTRSPKGGSPKARVAAATGSPKSPNSRVDTAAATPPGKALATGAAAHAAGLLAKEVHRLRPLLQESRADLLALKAEQDRSVVTLQAALLGILSRAPEAQKLPDVPTELHVEADAAGEPQDAAEEEAVEEEETAAEEEEAVEEAEEEEAGEAEEQEQEQEQEQELTSVQVSRLRTLLASVQGQLQQSERRRAESAAELQEAEAEAEAEAARRQREAAVQQAAVQQAARQTEGALAAAQAALEEVEARATAQKTEAAQAAANAAEEAEAAAAAAAAAAATAAARLVATEEARCRLDDELQARFSTSLQPCASKPRPCAFSLRATLPYPGGTRRGACLLPPTAVTAHGDGAGG